MGVKKNMYQLFQTVLIFPNSTVFLLNFIICDIFPVVICKIR